MENEKLYHFGGFFAFGMAAAVLANGVAFFSGPDIFFTLTRALLGVFAFGFFPALYAKGREAHPGWAAWGIGLAYLAVASEMIQYLGEVELNSAWLFLGGLGIMLLTYNILALRYTLWPKVLAWLGIVMSILLLGVIPSTLVEALAFLNDLAAVGAVALYPIWLVWIGMRFRTE